MNLSENFLRSGRAQIAALGAIAIAAFSGTFLIAGRAHAGQITGKVTPPMIFAPTELTSRSVGTGVQTLEVDLMVPTDSNAQVPFRVHAVAATGETHLDLPLSLEEPMRVEAFIRPGISPGTFELRLRNPDTGDVSPPSLCNSEQLVAIRVSPAVTARGAEILPTAGAVTVHGVDPTTSQVFQYAVPATDRN